MELLGYRGTINVANIVDELRAINPEIYVDERKRRY